MHQSALLITFIGLRNPKWLRSVLFALLISVIAASPVIADDYRSFSLDLPEKTWVLGGATTIKTSPYINDSTQDDFMPIVAYRGDYGYILGPEAGLYLYNWKNFRLDAFTAYRFAGYDDEDNDALDGMSADDGIDAGFKLNWAKEGMEALVSWRTDISDNSRGEEVQLEAGYVFSTRRWKIRPWAGAAWQSGDLVQYYYGVEPDEATPERAASDLNSHWKYSIGLDTSFRIDQHSVVTLGISETRLDTDVAKSSIVDEQNLLSATLSYQYQFSDTGPTFKADEDWGMEIPEGKWFWRVAGGLATEESFNRIVRGTVNKESRNTGIASVFIGRKISDTFLYLPIETYIKGGIVRHFERNVQPDFWEYVAAIKGYYNGFPWSDKVETRIGFAEGVSYAESIPIVERENVEKKNPSASHFLNYLDYSIDFNLGDAFNKRSWKKCYGGFSIHHRSGIFSNADIYGNVDGGSNFNTLYIECNFDG